jgi:hypothetical protein
MTTATGLDLHSRTDASPIDTAGGRHNAERPRGCLCRLRRTEGREGSPQTEGGRS